MRLYLSSFRIGNKPEELLRLAKGGKRTAVIFNAADFASIEKRADGLERELTDLKNIGLEPIEIDLRNYFGKQEDLREALSSVDILWVRGDNSFILRRAFLESGSDMLIKELLSKDSLVYGGYSAGIDMLTPSLHGVELVDDPHVIPAGYKPEIIWECLNILTYSIVPHYKSDHPESPSIDKSIEYLIDNHMTFIALRDGEVLVKEGDQEKVVG